MNVRDIFNHVRRESKHRFNLRARMVVFVTLELIGCALIAVGLDALLKKVVRLPFEVPMIIEWLLVACLVGILVTSQLSKYFFNPIKKLGDAMDQVGKGDFSVHLEEKTDIKEIKEIYTGFNLMVRELRATEILQTDFVSNVSHEFKTPINAIEGYSTLLQGGDNLDDAQKEYVNKILFNTRCLSSLVGSILLLSKLENQQIPTKQISYRLDEQIRKVIVAQEMAWDNKEIILDVDLDCIHYTGNEQMMYHVWDNLLSNAIKFSPLGGTIKLRLTKEEDQFVFFIEDQGPGIKEEAQKHIFDKFYQEDSSHKQEGNGLGLALVKRILSIEKGQIRVENVLSGGCRFSVCLRAN